MDTRLPSLGPRGEGWVAGQVVLFVLIAATGLASLASRGGLPGWLVLFGGAAIVIGLGLVVRATMDLGPRVTPFPRPVAGAELVDRGAFRLVRHPIYTGLVLAGLGWSAATGSVTTLVLVGLLALLFDAKSRREEAWLVEALPGYAAYRARTRRFVPGLY